MDMNPDSARAILYSRGMSPRQVSEGFRGHHRLPKGSAARFVSCAEDAEDTARSRETFFGNLVRNDNGALPENARDLVQSIAGLRIEAQAWRALAREAEGECRAERQDGPETDTILGAHHFCDRCREPLGLDTVYIDPWTLCEDCGRDPMIAEEIDLSHWDAIYSRGPTPATVASSNS